MLFCRLSLIKPGLVLVYVFDRPVGARQDRTDSGAKSMTAKARYCGLAPVLPVVVEQQKNNRPRQAAL
jgi:hypothetical protein